MANAPTGGSGRKTMMKRNLTWLVCALSVAGCTIETYEGTGEIHKGECDVPTSQTQKPAPACRVDTDCKAGESCASGACKVTASPTGCAAHAECSASQYCATSGECVSTKVCAEEAECDPGFNCDSSVALCLPASGETCTELADESSCTTRSDCEPVYAGVGCSCGSDCTCVGGTPGCVCESFEFFRCEPVL